MNKGLKAKIFELREQGLPYRAIEKKLGCSRSLVSYHCGEGQKDKTRNRQRKDRKENVLKRKVQRFQEYNAKNTKSKKEKDQRLIKKILQNKIRGFSLTGKRKDKTVKCKIMFKLNDFLKKIGPNPTCYLTGRSINLAEGKSYHLDHILPRSKGGDNSLANCGIACKAANQAKTDMTLEEFVQLCREVVEKNRPTQ